MMRAKPIQTTKWGTACAQCAAAKAKCSRQSGSQGSRCDRCERLLKQCTDQVHRPRKIRQPKQQSPYRSRETPPGAFEAFRDIASSTAHSPSLSDLGASSASSIGDPISSPPSPQGRMPNTLAPTCHNSRHGYAPSIPAAAACLCRVHDGMPDTQPESDAKLLDMFRTEMVQHYPFVVIPHQVDADTLQAQRPFVMSSIRLVASLGSGKWARRQMHNIMSHVASQMLLRAERSADLLMGILIVLGWYHSHCMRHSQFNNLLCLAESLAADMGLWKGGAERTSEDKRLLLGVWYLRSSAAIHFHLLDSIPWTNTLSQYVSDLKQAKEYPSDLLLVELVGIQQVTEKTVDTAGQDVSLPELQANLEGMLAMASGCIATTHIKTALLRLQETKSDTANHQSLACIKSWFESWLRNISASAHHALPTSVVFQLVYAVIMLFRWLDSSSQKNLTGWLGDHQDLATSRRTPVSRSTSPAPSLHPRDVLVADAMTAIQGHLAQMGIPGAQMVDYIVALGVQRGAESGLLSSGVRATTPISDAVLSAMARHFTDVVRASSAQESDQDCGHGVETDPLHRLLEVPRTQAACDFDYSYDYPVASIEDSLPSLHVTQVGSSSVSPIVVTSEQTQWVTAPSWDWTPQLTPQANSHNSHGSIMTVEGMDPQLWFDTTTGQPLDQHQGKSPGWEHGFEHHFPLGYPSGV